MIRPVSQQKVNRQVVGVMAVIIMRFMMMMLMIMDATWATLLLIDPRMKDGSEFLFTGIVCFTSRSPYRKLIPAALSETGSVE